MIDEVATARTWLRYFARPAKHWAPRSVEEYTRRVSVWAGEPIRPDAFLEAASQLNYEMGRREDGSHKIKAAVT